MIERCFLSFVSLVLLGSVGALFYFVALVPWFVAMVVVVGMALMFALGFCIRPRSADGQIEEAKAGEFRTRTDAY
jgi:hypothetical protein